MDAHTHTDQEQQVDILSQYIHSFGYHEEFLLIELICSTGLDWRGSTELKFCVFRSQEWTTPGAETPAPHWACWQTVSVLHLRCWSLR